MLKITNVNKRPVFYISFNLNAYIFILVYKCMVYVITEKKSITFLIKLDASVNRIGEKNKLK